MTLTIGRRPVLAALILFFSCRADVAEAQRPTDFSSLRVVTTQVSGDVHKLESPVSGNTAALIGNDGVLLVDAQYAPMHAKLMAAVKTLSPRPLRFLINTHFHRDHSEGNVHIKGNLVLDGNLIVNPASTIFGTFSSQTATSSYSPYSPQP